LRLGNQHTISRYIIWNHNLPWFSNMVFLMRRCSPGSKTPSSFVIADVVAIYLEPVDIRIYSYRSIGCSDVDEHFSSASRSTIPQ
jgi:hypothetical protein